MQQDPFVILGVDKNATQAEIDEKYRELRHRYEDARFLEGEAGAEAAEKIEELDNAYSEAMRIKSESANIGGGFHDDSDFKGQDFSEVKEAIKNKNYHLAQGLLDAMQERSAEWHYMQAKIYYDKKWILRNINLIIPKGKTIALVGQSGGGKSTLVDLIPRYYDVQEGEVLIDGINVKDIGIHDLRQLIGNVNQEAILFNDSFRNNIAFGVDNATDEQIAEAAKIANAYDFIMQSELQFNTTVGDRGSRLSGGQRQRVSIARAILKNPPILILDEATSALDTESERLVQDALERLMKTRTTVAIAHRLSTIKCADEICVIHEGEIVERGTHEELLAIDGYYKKLNDMQSL